MNYLTEIKNQKETAFSDYKLLQVTSKNISLHGLANSVGHCQPMVLWYNNPHMEVTGKDIIKE